MIRHGDVTQNSDTTRHIDTTGHSDVTQNRDTTKHVDIDITRHATSVLLEEEILHPAKRATMQQNTNESYIVAHPLIKVQYTEANYKSLRSSKIFYQAVAIKIKEKARHI